MSLRPVPQEMSSGDPSLAAMVSLPGPPKVVSLPGVPRGVVAGVVAVAGASMALILSLPARSSNVSSPLPAVPYPGPPYITSSLVVPVSVSSPFVPQQGLSLVEPGEQVIVSASAAAAASSTRSTVATKTTVVVRLIYLRSFLRGTRVDPLPCLLSTLVIFHIALSVQRPGHLEISPLVCASPHGGVTLLAAYGSAPACPPILT